MNADAMTLGFDHVGLTVADLESSRRFFVDCLGWKVVGERPVTIEFPPEQSGNGPKLHMMIREPGGNRIELSWDPR
ncbi:MAG TPA: VOC family protein [Polyangia bacterium]